MAAPLERVMWAVSRRLCRSFQQYESVKVCCLSTSAPEKEPDPLPLFARKDIQRLLRRVTGFDVDKVTSSRAVPFNKPKYRLLTDEELKEVEEKAIRRAKYKLQMPPYMNLRKPISRELRKDEELQGLDDAKLVVTDITFGVSDRARTIVVRDPDGTLRTATWEERDKINQIYNPLEGRLTVIPEMFLDQQLESLLKRKRYMYILDRACVQFEPDHPDYIRVTHRCYQHIDDVHDYEHLRSTRHFGPMTFHLVWNKQIDYLLIDMLQRDLVEDAGDLLGLYHTINPTTASATYCHGAGELSILDTVKIYCEKDSRHKGQLELAIQGVEVKSVSATN